MNITTSFSQPSSDPVQKKEIASRNVDKSLHIDCNAPRLIEQMGINQQTGSTASGFTDQDYPNFSGIPLVMKNMSQIKCVNSFPLPPEIVDHFTHVQCHCMMGLFSEIGRAWLTVDSDIYVWTYEEHTDLAYFDGINETILCVGLVKPKPGVFHAFIKYLLVLATAVDIVVLGVTFTDGPTENTDEIQLIPDPVFTIPTDGSTVSVIAGTDEGRLFYGTKEGSLFEISYQAESGWFGKRCKKVNLSTSTLSFLVPSFLNAALSEEDGISQISIDDSRNILYSLSEKGTIEVCDLGEKGNSFSRIDKMTQTTLVNMAMNTVKTLDSQNFRPIISISAVEATDSSNINLVAVSQTGVRFYMSVVGLSNLLPNQRPYTLSLMHVRLPPGYSANVTVRPRAVHVSHYRDRNLLLISTVNEKDVLWCMSSDLFPFSCTLMEAYTAINLDGPALAIAEVREEPNLYCPKDKELAPTVVRQHVEAAKKYVVLTSHGVQIFTKLRPVDILKQILASCQGKDSEALRAYFMIQKDDQACATALILATLQGSDNAWVSQYAASAFFLLGGEPKLSPAKVGAMFAGSTMFQPPIISTPAPHHFQQPSFQTSPNLSQTLTQQGAAGYDISGPFIFSAKHNGLYLYLGRILRPLWNRRCVDKTCIDGKTITNQSTITAEDCMLVVKSLNDLHKFLSVSIQQNNTTVRNVNVTMNVTRTNLTDSDAQLEERNSLDALMVLVNHARQIMGLWRILCEHQLHSLIAVLPDNQQQYLQSSTFKDLFLYRADICSILITTLVNSYLGDNASVDSISNKLREVCPDLYKTEDAQYSKASEILKAARSVQNIDEKEEMLHSALQLCKSIVPNINLIEVCNEFTALKAYKAVVELCAHSAQKLDPKKIAENYYNTDDHAADLEGFSYYQKRMEIYRQLLFLLENLYNEQNQNEVPCITCEPRQGTSSSIIMDGRDPAVGSVLQQVINEILDVSDDIMHFALYEWMGSKNMISHLIKINNPSLETYLKRSAIQSPDNIAVMDLLWKYYESNNSHAAAAKILNGLASRSGNNVPLKDRLAYLSRAIMCMRSDKLGYQPCLGVFLRDLEDKMEVAKVQEQILDSIMNMQSHIPNAQEAIAALNSGLYEISQLYENFAEPFKLLECQLAIIDCAGYTDHILIESIWQQILSDQLMQSSGSGSDRIAHILMKVENLSNQYDYSSHCFPLSYIVYELERVNAKLNGDKSLVPTTLYSMSIPFNQLISVYNRLISLSINDQFWQVEENECHLSLAAAALIDCFIRDQDKYNSVEKRKITSMCQDTVSALLSNLYSKPNTDQLVNRLRGIQAQLSRI